MPTNETTSINSLSPAAAYRAGFQDCIAAVRAASLRWHGDTQLQRFNNALLDHIAIQAELNSTPVQTAVITIPDDSIADETVNAFKTATSAETTGPAAGSVVGIGVAAPGPVPQATAEHTEPISESAEGIEEEAAKHAEPMVVIMEVKEEVNKGTGEEEYSVEFEINPLAPTSIIPGPSKVGMNGEQGRQGYSTSQE